MAKKWITTYDGKKIHLELNGQRLFSVQKVGYSAKQKKEFVRALGEDEKSNRGQNVIGMQSGAIEYSLDIELKEFNGALLEPVVQAERNGTEVLKTTTIDGQTVECLQDLHGLELVIYYPPKNGVQRKAKFFNVEITDDSGDISLEEATNRKITAIASGAEGLV